MKKLNAHYKKGQIILIAVLFFLGISTIVLIGLISPLVTQIKGTGIFSKSTGSYLLAEAAVEDVLYRLKTGKQVSNSATYNLGGGSATVVVTNTANGKQITATGDSNNNIRKIQANVVLGDGVAFHYGVQVGQGGFILENSSSIKGNVHSSGSIRGAGNYIYGDAISSGHTGLIENIIATGTAFSNTIKNSTIQKDAYYQTRINTTVGGTAYPNSPDQEPVDLPISDEQISDWQAQAEAGGTISNCQNGNYTISSNTTLGPVKINCNLVISGNGTTLTVTGYIWVVGNITMTQAPIVKMHPSLGSSNVAIIADNPANRSGSGQVDLRNNTDFQSSGANGSYVFIISQNNSAENGGSNFAITMNQGTGALILYASHGEIQLAQSITVKAVTAYRIRARNTAQVVYDTGLPNTLFSSGPSGGYEITSWKEISE
jgi:hypothetical protein